MKNKNLLLIASLCGVALLNSGCTTCPTKTHKYHGYGEHPEHMKHQKKHKRHGEPKVFQQNYGRYAKFLLKNTHWFLLTLLTGFIAWIWVGPIILTKKAIFYENLKTDF